MKRTIPFSVSILLFALAISIHFPMSRAWAQTTDEFIEALTPKSREEAVETETDSSIRQRGLGGVKAVKENPRTTMHLEFGLNSDEITPSAAATLQNLGQALERDRLRGFIYRLEGHTCDLGSSAHNMDLSRRRAFAVKQYLARHFSLSANQFEVAWYGESRPVVSNTDEFSRAKNRRVVVENTLRSFDQAKLDQPADLQIKRLRGDSEEVVKDGEVLGQNDNYSLEFKTASDPYVYIFQVDAAGKMEQLFPNSQVSNQQNPISPNAYYRIPERGNWLFLDENRGKEQLIFLSQQTPISDPQAMAASVFNGSLATGRTRGLGGIHKIQPPKEKAVSFAPRPAASVDPSPFILKRHFMHE